MPGPARVAGKRRLGLSPAPFRLPMILSCKGLPQARVCLGPNHGAHRSASSHHPVMPRELIRDPACHRTLASMRRTWTWTFDLPPDELWPVLADTNRFNEAMGLPTYVLEETPQANGTILRRGRGKAAGFTLEWKDKPYE